VLLQRVLPAAVERVLVQAPLVRPLAQARPVVRLPQAA
jgi:hypothetical protein